MCDSNGKRYRNRCHFDVERCLVEKRDGGSLQLDACQWEPIANETNQDNNNSNTSIENVTSSLIALKSLPFDMQTPYNDDSNNGWLNVT